MMFGFHVLCRRGSCLVSPQRVLFCAHPCPDATANSSYKTSNKESVSSTGRIQIVHIDSLRALRACVRVAVLISTVKHQFLSQSLSLSLARSLLTSLLPALLPSLLPSRSRALSLSRAHTHDICIRVHVAGSWLHVLLHRHAMCKRTQRAHMCAESLKHTYLPRSACPALFPASSPFCCLFLPRLQVIGCCLSMEQEPPTGWMG